MSLTEPELGLGILTEVMDKQLRIAFPAADLERVYGVRSSPLKRVIFQVGDQVKNRQGDEFIVEEVSEVDKLLTYHGNDILINERDLDDHLAFNKPEEKLYNNAIDTHEFFDLRLKTLDLVKKWETSQVKGLFGGRIGLISHQLYIAHEILKRQEPRVLLADEVGLGKTIEAGLIIHQLVTTGRAARVLVVVPEALTYQWFFEMHRKFQLGFVAINQETPPEEGINPFVMNERVIVSAQLLRGSKMAQDMLDECDFDILVVDEAHQYKKGSESGEYELLAKLCERIPSVLLLTATPEQLGLEGHFDRLCLLDPDRYFDFNTFKEEVATYENIAALTRSFVEKKTTPAQLSAIEELVGSVEGKSDDEVMRMMVDRHGTGRSFFRNTRATMRKEFDFFPKRILHEHVLVATGDEEDEFFSDKAKWLQDYLTKHDDKVLLICHGKKMVLRLEQWLQEALPSTKVGLFHSGQSLMARDRQAAYFADPSGSQILLCTEIGSEGRNFEFASHLVLFDLPKKPDLLEQRIGRLDRIGQKGDVNIHVPYVKDSSEEIIFRLYNEGLSSFQKFSSVGTPVFIKFRDELDQVFSNTLVDKDELISKMSKYREDLEREQESGRDLLIEMNSFDPKTGNALVKELKEWESSPELSRYMDTVFHCFGVDVEEINSYATYIRPNDNMFIPHFPYLDSEGLTFTFDRSEALEREDYVFLNWDHGMIREIMNLILSESYGNMTVAERRQSSAKAKKSFVEAYYVLDCPAPREFDIKRFFPPTVVRVLIDKDGGDFSDKWSKEELDEKLNPASRETIEKAQKIPRALLNDLLKKAEVKAQEKAQSLKDGMITHMNKVAEQDLERIEELSRVNKDVDEGDVVMVKAMNHALKEQSKEFRLRLEALRLIL